MKHLSPGVTPTKYQHKKSGVSRSNLSKYKSRSLFRLDECSEDYRENFTAFRKETSQVLKRKANYAKFAFSSAANRIRKDSYYG